MRIHLLDSQNLRKGTRLTFSILVSMGEPSPVISNWMASCSATLIFIGKSVAARPEVEPREKFPVCPEHRKQHRYLFCA
jgi:hypothetical protein